MKVNKLFNLKFENNHIISNLTDNSKDCILNSVFFVNNKNLSFLIDAIENGAKTIISEIDLNIDQRINFLKVKNIRDFQAKMLYKYYQNTLSKYKIIAVTGTNGKTSTATYIYKYLRYLKKDTLLISSNGIYLDDLKFDTRNTTPNIFKIYDYLVKNLNKERLKKVKKKEHYLILECSSQGIRNLRIKYIPIDIVVFTNITTDHMDFHINTSDYFFSKCLIFHNLKKDAKVIVNSTNCNTSLIEEICYNDTYTYGMNGDISYEIIDSSFTKTIFKIMDNNQTFEFTTKVVSKYQIENLLATYSVIKYLDIDLSNFQTFLNQLKLVDGRFNYFLTKKNQVIIDYAHTLNAVISTIDFVQTINKNKLWIVVGCGGDRDKSKRPLIGNYCLQNADYVIFTEDNNRSELFEDIIGDILSNPCKHNYQVIKNRFSAIAYAIDNSDADDCILILGKGTEYTKVFNNSLFEYLTDYQMVRKITND